MCVDVVQDQLGAHEDDAVTWDKEIGRAHGVLPEAAEITFVRACTDNGLPRIAKEFFKTVIDLWLH